MNKHTPHSAASVDQPLGLYIGGRWVDGGEPPIVVIDPSTGEPLAEVANASVEDARAALAAADRAAAGWAATPPRQRGEILRRAFDLMTARAESFAQLIALENGKSVRDARGEVAYAAEFFRWYSEESVRAFGQIGHAPSGANRIIAQYQPVGVSLLITPWNFPAAMATRKIGPALAAGCTCILKPASETPLTALKMAALLEEAGVPPGVVNVIPSRKSGDIAAALLADPRVRKLSFTGSTEVGRRLLHMAADCVVNCSMELGGNAPFIVLEDADLKAAVEGAMIAKMRNGGEACTAANRFIVHDAIYVPFVTALTERMAGLCIGSATADDTDLGPLINSGAVDNVDRLVRDAVANGAKLLTGGAPLPGPGYFYPPTVLGDVPASAAILSEEIFGPVAPIVRVASEDEAVRLANGTEYGLVSYVYSSNLTCAMRLAERLEAGMVAINRGLVSDPAAPFGGVKQSGIGREGGHDGMLEFMEVKYVAASW